MSALTLLLAILGLAGFAWGAALSATGAGPAAAALMGLGLVLQVMSLVRLRRAKARDRGNARR
jgi:hypothetical protein